jgi:hypothetical protein
MRLEWKDMESVGARAASQELLDPTVAQSYVVVNSVDYNSAAMGDCSDIIPSSKCRLNGKPVSWCKSTIAIRWPEWQDVQCGSVGKVQRQTQEILKRGSV